MSQEPAATPAVLAWCGRDDARVPEVLELCRSAGFAVVQEVRQARTRPDPHAYLGRGRLHKLELDPSAEALVVPAELSPHQTFELHRATGLSVVDRIRLILEVFKRHTSSPESRLQVELADLRYQVPIVREYVHLGKLGEHPGFMAGGEYRVDYYYDMIRRRISAIREELETIRRRRSGTRDLRRRRGAHLIALAGYTNAGKSTLLNALMEPQRADKEAAVGPEMFTTLATSTRRMRGARSVLVTDTVGFIRDLPPWLVEGFLSTLEEVFSADVVVLVVDASDDPPVRAEKLADSLSILVAGGARGGLIIAANKAELWGPPGRWDDLAEEVLGEVPEAYAGMASDCVAVSANDGAGIDDLVEAIHRRLPPMAVLDVILPATAEGYGALLDIRRRWGPVVADDAGGRICLTIALEPRWVDPAVRLVQRAGGEAVASGGRG